MEIKNQKTSLIVEVDIKFKMSFWDAVKCRISGAHNNLYSAMNIEKSEEKERIGIV